MKRFLMRVTACLLCAAMLVIPVQPTPGVSAETTAHYSLENSLIGQIPVGQTAAIFRTQAGNQFGAVVSLTDPTGAQIADDAVIGTGFTAVIMSPAEGSTVTYQTVIKGDTDGDGAITTEDVRRIMRSLLGANDLTSAQSAAADRDDNSKISSTDARQILLDCLQTV